MFVMKSRYLPGKLPIHPTPLAETAGLGETTAALKHWGSSSGNRFGFLQEFFPRFFIKGIHGSLKQNIKPPVGVVIMEVFPEVRVTFPNLLS